MENEREREAQITVPRYLPTYLIKQIELDRGVKVGETAVLPTNSSPKQKRGAFISMHCRNGNEEEACIYKPKKYSLPNHLTARRLGRYLGGQEKQETTPAVGFSFYYFLKKKKRGKL